MRTHLSLVLWNLAWIVAATSSCAMTKSQEPPVPNRLTDREAEDGWKLLFDGRTTNGWRGYRSNEMPAGWQAVDGALTRVAEAGDIVSVDQYDYFVLELEWRVAPSANSGIMFHVSEDHEDPWETGPEYQVLDDDAHKDGLDPRTSAGANYAMHAPSKVVTRPAGAWNQARIQVCGPVVEHWLNGEKIVQYSLWDDDWKARVAGCKWKDAPDYGQRRTGYIALQDHGDQVAFRSIKIRPIERAR
jgi:hypothetical protein